MSMFTPPWTKVAAMASLVLLLLGVALACGSRPSSEVPRPKIELETRPSPMPMTTFAPTATTARPIDAPPTRVVTPVADPGPKFVVRAGKGGPSIRASPDEKAASLTGLYFDTYLPVYMEWSDASGMIWYQVRLWGVLTGWIRADQTETGDPPPPTPHLADSAASTSAAPQSTPSGVLKLTTHGVATDWVNLRAAPGADSDRIDLLAPGTSLAVRAWQTDASASVWYQASAGANSGWVWSGAVELTTPKPSTVSVAGHPIWAPIAGKGMWMPSPLIEMADPTTVVEAARNLGLTHIYLETGASGRGFYGRQGVDRLVPVAHQYGIKVVGWVLTSLNDVPSDVSLCATIANYQTPSGDRLDGIAPDIEDNLDATDVSAFSQILRADLGPQRLIVGVIYPAGTWIGQQHPVAAILSHSFNALAPMAYWHESRHPYDKEFVSDFVRHAVADIHSAVDDPGYPVAVIGQTYDSFGRDGTGPDSPSGAEIADALDAARRNGAIGVSFFQWGTATPAEWNALKSFQWTSGAS